MIYVYKCSDCKETTDKYQKMNDRPLTVCESCGGELVKQMTAPSFQVKGGYDSSLKVKSHKPSPNGG